MIARLDGRVVLVSGAIPGERVTARVERVSRDVAYAAVTGVDDPSADRRPDAVDPGCGGCLYAHIAYPRQLTLKALVVADAFARIGRIQLPSAVQVQASPEHGYRMRARLHAHSGRVGFFRENTHETCDARNTGQLLPATCDAVERVAAALASLRADGPFEMEVSENIPATERVLLVTAASTVDRRTASGLSPIDGISGLVVAGRGRPDRLTAVWGGPYVSDEMTLGDTAMTMRRHVAAFFQGNRHLVADLVRFVISQVPPQSRVTDLYAGTGLFAIAAAMARQARVTAVEGDQIAALDLEANAGQADELVTPIHQGVEGFLRTAGETPDVVVVDPPRTGLSREAIDGVLRVAASRLVYVSCDPATQARDAHRLVEGGYAVESVNAFNLFPNTPHVETVAVFTKTR